MCQKSCSRTHPYIKITKEAANISCQLSLGASWVSICLAHVDSPCTSGYKVTGFSSSPHLSNQASDTSDLQMSQPASETCAELKQFRCKLHERTSPCSIRWELFSLFKDKDHVNAVKIISPALESALALYSKFWTAAQLLYWHPLVSLGNTSVLHWRCGAVSSQHCLLHTLFPLQRLTPETCMVGHALLISGLISYPVDNNGRIETPNISMFLLHRIESPNVSMFLLHRIETPNISMFLLQTALKNRKTKHPPPPPNCLSLQVWNIPNTMIKSRQLATPSSQKGYCNRGFERVRVSP